MKIRFVVGIATTIMINHAALTPTKAEDVISSTLSTFVGAGALTVAYHIGSNIFNPPKKLYDDAFSWIFDNTDDAELDETSQQVVVSSGIEDLTVRRQKNDNLSPLSKLVGRGAGGIDLGKKLIILPSLSNDNMSEAESYYRQHYRRIDPATLYHEIGHLKHNDAAKLQAFSTMSWLFIGLSPLVYGIDFGLLSTTQVAATSVAAIAYLLGDTFIRHQSEMNADKEITHEAYTQELREYYFLFDKKNGNSIKSFFETILLVSTHPSSKRRVRALDSRLGMPTQSRVIDIDSD